MGDDLHPPRKWQRPVAPRSTESFFGGDAEKDEGLKQRVLAASRRMIWPGLPFALGFEFSGDELLRFSGKKGGPGDSVKQEHPGEYH